MPRYTVSDALVLRRTPLPSGDVVVTLLSEHGTWRAVARKGKLPGGNLARLSLFHDVTVQAYRRRDDDLAVLTQVRLNGALSALARPEAYPYAHLIAELTDALTVDVHVGERLVDVVASALRGVAAHHDPDAVALAYAWRLVVLAGLAPRVAAEEPPHCHRCERPASVLAIEAGALVCDEHASNGRDVWLDADGARALALAVRGPLRRSVTEPPADRTQAWRALQGYLREHVGELRSLQALLVTRA